MSLRSSAKITSSMNPIPIFSAMGNGATDRIFLLGHAEGLTVNKPYQVSSMQEALSAMNATSPDSTGAQYSLVHGLLEAYYAGARDIWLVNVGTTYTVQDSSPSTVTYDYVHYNDRDGDSDTFYEHYYESLKETYRLIKKWDLAQITVPLEAPFNTASADFLTQLTNYCVEATEISGEIHLGIIGTRGNISSDYIDAMVDDPRLDQGNNGKFVSIFAGDALFNFREIGEIHTSSLAATVAGQLSNLPLDRSVTGLRVKNAYSVTGVDLTDDQVNTLAEAGINTATRNSRGRRGTPYQVTFNSDNTLAPSDSVYWSMGTMMLASQISAEIRTIGKRIMGTISYAVFRQEVEDYLLNLTNTNTIRDYGLSIYRDPFDPYRVRVDIVIRPYFGVREIFVPIEIGPHQGGN